MTKTIKHLKFLSRSNKSALIGIHPGGWENFMKYSTDINIAPGKISQKLITPEVFAQAYESYLPSLKIDDDLIRCLEPINSIPWTESACGCPIIFTGNNFWTQPITKLQDDNDFKRLINLAWENTDLWLEIYEKFIFFIKQYGLPIGQAILRGPLDMLASVIGEENLSYAIFDYPERLSEILKLYSDIFNKFVELHVHTYTPFMGGGVIGQYYIWTPGTTSRLQNDAMSILSPETYQKFVGPNDNTISGVADYNLYHIHASAFHQIDNLLKIKNINIFQISKDEGIENIEPMLDGLRKIQSTDKCLILKGRLDNQYDLELIRTNLSQSGLCLQFVCDSLDAANASVDMARSILPG